MSAEISCPNCESEDVTPLSDGSFVCKSCSIAFKPGHRTCDVCGQSNPPEAEECSNCSEPLTSFSHVITRHRPAEPPLRHRQMRAQAAEIQASELEESRVRMEEFEEIDRKREELNARIDIEQSERERRLLTYAFIATIVVLLVFFIIGMMLII